MAFTTELSVNGRNYQAAYIKATVARCDTTQTVLKLEVWETQALRQEGVPALNWPNDLRSLATNMAYRQITLLLTPMRCWKPVVNFPTQLGTYD